MSSDITDWMGAAIAAMCAADGRVIGPYDAPVVRQASALCALWVAQCVYDAWSLPADVRAPDGAARADFGRALLAAARADVLRAWGRPQGAQLPPRLPDPASLRAAISDSGALTCARPGDYWALARHYGACGADGTAVRRVYDATQHCADWDSARSAAQIAVADAIARYCAWDAWLRRAAVANVGAGGRDG